MYGGEGEGKVGDDVRLGWGGRMEWCRKHKSDGGDYEMERNNRTDETIARKNHPFSYPLVKYVLLQ